MFYWPQTFEHCTHTVHIEKEERSVNVTKQEKNIKLFNLPQPPYQDSRKRERKWDYNQVISDQMINRLPEKQTWFWVSM